MVENLLDGGGYGYIYDDDPSDFPALIGFYQVMGINLDVPLPPRLKATADSSGITNSKANFKALFDAAHSELLGLLAEDYRYSAIFFRRTVGRESLESLGSFFGITRERVRQLELGMKHLLEASGETLYEALGKQIAQRFLPLAPVSAVTHALPGIDKGNPSSLSVITSYFAPDWEIHGDWIKVRGFNEEVRRNASTLANRYGVVELAALAEALKTEEEPLAQYCTGELGYIRLENHILTQVDSHPDRCAAVLSMRGHPLTIREVFSILGQNFSRSMANQNAKDDRLVRVSNDKWGLSEWGIHEFSSVADWIGETVDSSDKPVHLTSLLAHCDRLGIAESTVRLMANNGEFITTDGIVTRGTADEPIGGDPLEAANLYFHNEDLYYLLTVNREHLRGSGFGVHRSIGAHYGLLFLHNIVLFSRLGPQYLRSSRSTPTALSTIRRWLTELHVAEGDRVWLRFGQDREFDVTHAPDLLQGGSLINRLGLDEWQKQGETDLETINRALGMAPNAPRRRTVAIFRHRRQDDIADEIAELP